jgi:itaconate CoA-transferase
VYGAQKCVITPRLDTHYLVTEYGAVNLMGKFTYEQALEVVKLAHPKFRDSLMEEAKKMCPA